MADERTVSKRAMRLAAIEGEIGSNDHAKGEVRYGRQGNLQYHSIEQNNWSILTQLAAFRFTLANVT